MKKFFLKITKSLHKSNENVTKNKCERIVPLDVCMVPHHPIAIGTVVHCMTMQSAHCGAQQSAQISGGVLRVSGLANTPIHQISREDFVGQVPSFYSLQKQPDFLNIEEKTNRWAR